eukprot:Phypoly_transcript_17380.p1 GENE.Phypoly_transcript_17380~~Phypoly_transcript_17380.p1  ORF type:complete len:221 (-),score=32.30 Phypoly_transcript_17380:43-705(-)
MAAAVASPNATSTIQRNRPGTKNKDLFAWGAVPLDSMESTFAAQQYIQQLIRADPTDVEAILKVPEGTDEAVWQYEHLRQFTLEFNQLVVLFDPVCNETTCPQMKATDEWLYLCAAHKTPKECCAIDYIIHTLDGTAALLNSDKYFPSRVSISESSLKYFQSIARRLYRVFSHAYFHHRDLFDQVENETRLCERFVRFSTRFKLIPKKLQIIPESFMDRD